MQSKLAPLARASTLHEAASMLTDPASDITVSGPDTRRLLGAKAALDAITAVLQALAAFWNTNDVAATALSAMAFASASDVATLLRPLPMMSDVARPPSPPDGVNIPFESIEASCEPVGERHAKLARVVIALLSEVYAWLRANALDGTTLVALPM